ncbi:MAG: tRNA (adenosine(37)-N6)-threonylcarbamoyltransferase complex dimerization subunit type 1 TsaB [Bacteroidales bacterium]|nr:tRNA (adenosine(37)-N6)-threonylcarbamoyltransferase complex dimerization subunit type 1 TsaB [Bacteroidales bacterium]
MSTDKDILILAIETSTDICSVALSRNGKTLDSETVSEPRMQTSRLAPMIEELLKRNGLTVKDCAAVAVSSGPGSYTGLRVGVSMAKGLCFGAGIPLIGVGTLDLLAAQGKAGCGEKPDFIVPMIDARRMEVYQAVFDGNGIRTGEISPKILDSSSYSELPAGSRVLFCGNGCEKFRDTCGISNAIFAPYSPLAEYMSQLAYLKFTSSELEDTAYMEPFYLKEFTIGTYKKKILG